MEVVQFPLEIQTPKRSLFSRVRVGANADVEVDMDPEQQKQKLLESKERRSKRAFYFELLTLATVTGVFVLFAVLIIRIVQYCDQIRLTVEPDVLNLVNLTMKMVAHTESTLENVMLTTHAVHSLSANSLPSMIRALNDTATMVSRLENMIEHPQFQLSLLPGTPAR